MPEPAARPGLGERAARPHAEAGGVGVRSSIRSDSTRRAVKDAVRCAKAVRRPIARWRWPRPRRARVATRHPDALVIGADQILVCDGQWFDKPEDRADGARASC